MSSIYAIAAITTFILFTAYITDFAFKKYLTNHYVIIIAIGLAARILAFRIPINFSNDIQCFKSWADMLFHNGFANFYLSKEFTDYPPGYMYVLYVLGFIKAVFELDYAGSTYTALIKFPAIAMDIATGIFIYRIARKHIKSDHALAASLVYLLNPAILLDSAVWGQVDSVYTFFILISIYWLTERKYHQGFALFAAAILIKPQALIFSPIYLFTAVSLLIEKSSDTKALDKKTLTYLFGIFISCVLIIFTGIVPFTRHLDFTPVIDQYINTLQSYSYATVNAYNLYAFIGANWKATSDLFLGIPFFAWGTFFIILTVAAGFHLLFRNKSAFNYFFTAGLINACTFMLSVKMHERYIYPTIVLCLVAWIYKRDKRFLLLFCGFSITFFINCCDILNLYGQESLDMRLISESLPLVSLINLCLFCFMIYTAFTIDKTSAVLSDESMEDNTEQRLIQQGNTGVSTMTRRDYYLLAGLMLVYTIIAFVNLGNLKSPQTLWTARIGQEAVFELDEPSNVTAIEFIRGPRHDKRFSVYYSDDGVDWTQAIEISEGSVFAWLSVTVDFDSRYIKITSKSTDLMILEMAFKNSDGQILNGRCISQDGGTLFDEQKLVPDKATYMNSSYFDEIYHPRTAYEFLHQLSVYEWTHPPLGKAIMALGIKIFGMTPFGWRFMGTLFGVLMIPVMYLFGKRMFRKTEWAFFAAFILTFDFMHFSQTRLATIDTYVTIFVMLMYYFMYRYYTMSFYNTPLRKTLVPLCLSGISMGLACACKWPGLYAAAGLAVIFFYTLYLHHREWQCCEESRKNRYMQLFVRNTAITLSCCIVFFIAIPLIIYTLSYIPYLYAQGVHGLKDSVTAIIDNQKDMFNYHTYLESEHPYSSQWWKWPIMLRPIFYYSELTGSVVLFGKHTVYLRSGINSFGNPAVWWTGIVAFFYCISASSRKTDDKPAVLFLLTGLAAQLLPWVLVTRTTYIYHYFPSVPFIVLMITYFFRDYVAKRNMNLSAVYIGIVLALFILFYPVLSGMPVFDFYVNYFLRWLPSWQLI